MIKSLLHVTLAHACCVLAISITLGACGEVTDTAPVEPIADSPVPTIRSISPIGVSAGASRMSFAISCTNFVRGSVVRWDGNDRATGFHGDTLLGAAILDGDMAVATVANVTVFSPPPGGGTSNAVTFSILNPRSDGRRTVVFGFSLPAGYVGSLFVGAVSVGNGPVDVTLDFSGNFVILACVGASFGCTPMGGRPDTRVFSFPAGEVRASVYFNSNFSQPPGDAAGTVAFTFNPF